MCVLYICLQKNLTVAVSREAVLFDDLHLDLCGDREHDLHHLHHVAACVVTSLVQTTGVLRNLKC